MTLEQFLFFFPISAITIFLSCKPKQAGLSAMKLHSKPGSHTYFCIRVQFFISVKQNCPKQCSHFKVKGVSPGMQAWLLKSQRVTAIIMKMLSPCQRLEVWLNHQAPDSSPGRTNAVMTSPENSKWEGGGDLKKIIVDWNRLPPKLVTARSWVVSSPGSPPFLLSYLLT